MSDTSEAPDASSADPVPALPRRIADAYVDRLAELDPLTSQSLGLNPGDDRLPDFSPDGFEALAELSRRTLAELDAAEANGSSKGPQGIEQRCARLLRERLTAGLAVHEAGEDLRRVSNIHSPVHWVREIFQLMPTESDEDWAVLAGRLRRVPESLAGYRASLQTGLDRRLPAGPRQVATVIGQLGEWVGGAAGRGWFAELVSAGPEARRAELDAAAVEATAAVAGLRDWLRDHYAPAVDGSPDPVGRERYTRWVREWSGADLDPDEAYTWGWEEFHRILDEMRTEADKVLPGSTPLEAMQHLDRSGEAIEGVENIRSWLQDLMDEAMAALHGTHFDLAEPVRRVEAMIAPPGSAAAPYYTAPSLDFSRPGRTWLPTQGANRFPVYDLVSTWYHEGVPGHHLQLAQWVHVSEQLSRYQATVGLVSANVEGWALYAERLMDELGFLTDPGRRLGYLDAQMMRAVRVIIDIGMHLELAIPASSARRIGWEHGGERWTPKLARDFFGRYSGRPADFLDSELVRYLGMPGQAIGYKLGERAWLAGREAARRAQGAAFDLKSWHMAALSQGSLGLDDLAAELTVL